MLEALNIAVELTVVLADVTTDTVTDVLNVVEPDELSVDNTVLDSVELLVAVFVVVTVVVADVRSQA